MLSPEFLNEINLAWLPNISDRGLDRVIDLLEKGSPLLLAGRFTSAAATGCLATHIGWHHEAVCGRTDDAGIMWLTRVAGLNPATSHVIREWDKHDPREWGIRQEMLALFHQERARRSAETTPCVDLAFEFA